MSSAKGKRGQPEEHENEERWLLTYSDMITPADGILCCHVFHGQYRFEEICPGSRVDASRVQCCG